jgi:hypothetical protein
MTWLWPLLARFGTRTLALFFGILLLIDLIVPDPLPFVDELLLGLTTVLLARRGQRRP